MPVDRRRRKTSIRRKMTPAAGSIDERAVIESVGLNCAAFRKDRGHSLDALARLSGLSKGMLVEIEQRRTNPSIATLCRIANALDVGLAEILQGVPAKNRLVHHAAAAGKELWRTSAGSSATLIDAARVRDVGGELWRWTLASHEAFDGASHPDGTQEFLYVMKGILAVDVAGESVRCVKGEALRIRADAPHKYRNAADGPCVFIMCVVEPIAH